MRYYLLTNPHPKDVRHGRIYTDREDAIEAARKWINLDVDNFAHVWAARSKQELADFFDNKLPRAVFGGVNPGIYAKEVSQ